jgi:hypothetical protein
MLKNRTFQNIFKDFLFSFVINFPLNFSKTLTFLKIIFFRIGCQGKINTARQVAERLINKCFEHKTCTTIGYFN